MTKVFCTHCMETKEVDFPSGGVMIYKGKTVGIYGDHLCKNGKNMGTWVEVIMPNNKPKWEERLLQLQFSRTLNIWQSKTLKAFISQELQKQKEEIVEMIEDMMLDYDGEASDALFFLKDDIIKKIEGKYEQ